MRRFISVVSVIFVVSVGFASGAGAREVVNSSGSQEEISINWDFSTEDGTFVFGSAQGIEPKGGEPFVNFFEQSVTEITCDNGTPDDPDDDFLGARFEFVSGSGPGTVDIDGRYRSGSASAILDLFVDSFDDCFFFPENGGGGTVIKDVPVSLSATATSSLIRSTNSSGFHIPSEVNENSRFDSRYRIGTGTATWGDNTQTGFAQIGKTSWRFHSNS